MLHATHVCQRAAVSLLLVPLFSVSLTVGDHVLHRVTRNDDVTRALDWTSALRHKGALRDHHSRGDLSRTHLFFFSYVA